MKRSIAVATSSLVALSLLALAGCAVTHGSRGPRSSDAGITAVIVSSLEASEQVKARQVDVETRDGVVYLTGMVDTRSARREAGRIAWRTEGVDGVVNDLTVGEMTVGIWVDDAVVGSKVRAKLNANAEIRAGDVDVDCTHGVVTLLGRVRTEQIKSHAGHIARETRGVKEVNNELEVGRARR